jgi:hypothetical protein
MTRKAILLGAVFFFLLLTSRNFYSDALVYDPMHAVSGKRQKTRESGEAASRYGTAWSSDIVEKNLFNPSRKGPLPPPPSPPPPPPPPRKPDLSLRGVVLNPSGEYVAYVEIDKAKAIPMRRGDMVADIKVDDISDRRVVLQWMDEKIPLSMERITTLYETGAAGGMPNFQRPGAPSGQPAFRARRRPRMVPE